MADQPEDLFSGDPTPGEPTNTPSGEPVQKSSNEPNLESMLTSIKNENGEPKYKSLEDALKALDHSQKYIPHLEVELNLMNEQMEMLRERSQKSLTAEQALERLLESRQSEGKPTSEPSAGLDEQAVIDLVKKSLDADKKTT